MDQFLHNFLTLPVNGLCFFITHNPNRLMIQIVHLYSAFTEIKSPTFPGHLTLATVQLQYKSKSSFVRSILIRRWHNEHRKQKNIDTTEDQFEASSVGQALLRVAIVTLIVIVTAALVLLAVLLVFTR
jgi:hypothetical protein